jgi:hypothetical protein
MWISNGTTTGNRIQLTSDGYRGYERAAENTFGCEVDYSMLVKIYGAYRQ